MDNDTKRKTAKAIAEKIAGRYVTKEARLSASVIAHEAALDALGYGEAETDSDTFTFTLTITLGNDGMQSGADIQDALKQLSNNYPSLGRLTLGNVAGGVIRDVNGNTVGSWGVK